MERLKTIGIWILIVVCCGGFMFGLFLLPSINIVKERKVYLSDLKPTYYVVGYGQLKVYTEDSEEVLAMYVGDEERKSFEHGFFAHAYSTIVFDDLKSYHLTKFSTYFGVNETARNNGNTSMEFMIYFDDKKVYQSEVIRGDFNSEKIDLEIKDSINRITLVIDCLEGNGNDHGVWADPLIFYSANKELK